MIDGFRIVINLNSREDDQLQTRVRGSLDVIAQYDSRLYCRMRKENMAILVTEGIDAEYWPFSNTIVLGERFVVQYPVDQVAAAMVHEAVHARLFRSGIPLSGKWRTRVERSCINQEIIFAQRIPSLDYLVDHLQRSLESQWWTGQTKLDTERQALKELGAPSWILRFHRWRRSIRLGK
jgi:hypothetical protein